MVEDIKEAIRDFSGFPSPVIGMVTTPSNLPEDARMEDPTHSDADVDMAPPPPLNDPPVRATAVRWTQSRMQSGMWY